MKHKSASLILLIILLYTLPRLGFSQPAPHSTPPLVPLYMAYSASSTDHFYTVDLDQYNIAISYGFAPKGVVAYLESTNAPNTQPFRRYYASALTDHFYTHLVSEQEYVLDVNHERPASERWEYEGVEGYIYTTKVPGSIALYRLNKYTINGGNGDLDHYYTTSLTQKDAYVRQGWLYDGIAGYVYSSPTPAVTGGFITGYRAGISPDYQFCEAYWRYTTWGDKRADCQKTTQSFGRYSVSNTNRPPGYGTQVVTFKLTNYGLEDGGDHIGVMLRANYDWSGPNLSNNYYYWGSGFIFGKLSPYTCPTQDFASEAFDYPTSTVPPSSCSGTLANGVAYNVTVTANATGIVSYQVRRNSVLIASGSYNANLVPGWHPESQGLIITPAHVGIPSDYTVYIEDIKVQWLP